MKEIKFDIEYDHSNESNETAKLLVLEGNFNYKQQIKDILESKNKLYTQIKIDEITNLGAVKIRLRSLLGALEERGE